MEWWEERNRVLWMLPGRFICGWDSQASLEQGFSANVLQTCGVM